MVKSFTRAEIIAAKTANPIAIFIGKPTTKRLNCGIVFISIPKIRSAKRDNAKIGNEIIKPNKNRFMTPFAVDLTIFSSG